MKKLFVCCAYLLALLTSCYNNGNGELVGVLGRPQWFDRDPFGTVYIGGGAYNMGPSDQSVPYAHTTRSKTVSVQAFYMDITEITNNEYRQFVFYVRDSIAHRIIGEDVNPDHLIEVDQYGQDIDPPQINWDERIYWNDEEERDALADMFLPEHERFYRRKEIDTRKLKFEYYWVDLKHAAQRAGQDLDLSYTNSIGQNNAIRGHIDRSKFIIKEVVNVYPDTLTWVRDFTYSFNEPMTNMYFWHPAYDEYPVVGLTWVQCKAFCVWRSQLMNSWLNSNGETFVNDFRLPTEAEWEYAARGGLDLNPYPWGGPYVRNSLGCFLGNYKPMRGSYMVDGGFHTVKVNSYSPNDYGLYCMAGNVAEWTNTAYDESVYEFSHDLNPEYSYLAKANDPPALKRKVIRGGSWKDVGFYMQNGSRTYEYRDTAKSYIGFRCVQTYLGRGKKDWNSDI